ncbi:hypothetical protein GOODEAATRI_020075, partial [Goodea atripinnis]
IPALSRSTDHSLKAGNRLHTARFAHSGLRPARRFGRYVRRLCPFRRWMRVCMLYESGL